MKRKILSLIFSIILLLGLCPSFFACAPLDDDGKIDVISTIFPIFDMVENLSTDGNIHSTLLVNKKVDFHNYQPSVRDIARISTCDVFIYVGGESDKWVDDALKNKQNDKMIVLNLLDALSDRALLEDEEHEDETHEHQTEYDEHVWLSVKNAKIICKKICEILCEVDESNMDLYKTNLTKYLGSLDTLDSDFEGAITSASKPIVFADRFPFKYLFNDYNLNNFSAFRGCSAETEASFSTIVKLITAINKNDVKVIFILDGSSPRLAETIRANTKSKDQKILTINSLQTMSDKDIERGASYIQIMQENLSNLKLALN